MLAVLGEDDMTDDMLRNGTRGYVLRSDDTVMLLHAINEMSRGVVPHSNGIVREVMVHMQPPQHASTADPGLSPREKQVLRCLVDGLSYKMIADQLTISFETVRSHIKHIYEKLNVHNNTEAVAKALKTRLVA